MRNAVRLICSRMAGSGNPWLVEGDAALAMQGVAVGASRLRIITDRLGAYELGTALREFGQGIKTVRQDGATTYQGEFKVFTVPLDVVGDWVIRYDRHTILMPVVDMFLDERRIDLSDFLVPVVPLEWQLVIDILTGRDDRHLRTIMDEEPDHAKVFRVVENLGLFNEVKHVLGRLF
ncbi:hypothetical protein JW905_01215 [bacterium]|nr:hypothetical protein [candidate division CSSED10-310 bacterium]